MIDRLRERLVRFKESIPSILVGVIKDNENDILTDVKDHLWDGKEADGDDLMPFIKDPWFQNQNQAIGYMNWKNAVTPNPNRNPMSPNLFINGYFYSTLQVESSEEGFQVISRDSAVGLDVMRKYGLPAFGITNEYFNEVLRKEMVNRLKLNI